MHFVGLYYAITFEMFVQILLMIKRRSQVHIIYTFRKPVNGNSGLVFYAFGNVRFFLFLPVCFLGSWTGKIWIVFFFLHLLFQLHGHQQLTANL